MISHDFHEPSNFMAKHWQGVFPAAGEERRRVLKIIREGIEKRPKLPQRAGR